LYCTRREVLTNFGDQASERQEVSFLARVGENGCCINCSRGALYGP
jgi:hypothetical protein